MKSTSGGLNYASASIASPQHIAAELLRLHTGAAIQAVTYKGEGPALIDIVAGQVPFMFVESAGGMPAILPPVARGRPVGRRPDAPVPYRMPATTLHVLRVPPDR